MSKQETKTEEKLRMIATWDYYQKPNGEVDCLFHRKSMRSVYGAPAVFILQYMRQIHKCSLIPIKTS